MSSMKDIKQRIENVSSVEQIVKAMDMVASTKLVKARAQLEGVRPIYHELKRIVEELGSQKEIKNHAFFQECDVKNSLYIVLTSDRGLSGSYNANVQSKALKHMRQGKNEKIFVIGSKGKEFFKTKKKNIVREVIDVVDSKVYFLTESIARWVANCYLSGEVEEVYVVYTHFENVLNYVPMIERLLPIATQASEDENNNDKKYEPDINTFVDNIIPLYVHMNLFRAFSESHTSEQAARMINMDAAGKNASDIIEELTRMYNRKRQSEITQELTEIVGSANILNKGGLHDG